MLEHKTCPHCNKTYYAKDKDGLLTYFNWRNKKKKILASYCKNCRSEMNKQRYSDNKDDFLERNKEYYENHKDKFKEYYQKNKEERKESSHSWNINNKDKRVSYNKNYYKKKMINII